MGFILRVSNPAVLARGAALIFARKWEKQVEKRRGHRSSVSKWTDAAVQQRNAISNYRIQTNDEE